MLCGTHLQQHLAEAERGFLVLCSTKETKPHYCYTHEAGAPDDNTIQEALGKSEWWYQCSGAVKPEML